MPDTADSRLPSPSAGPAEASASDSEVRIQTGFLLHEVSVMRQALFERYIRPFVGVTSAQAWILIDLTRHKDQGMTQVQLARLRKIGKVALGQMIDKLEQGGFVERKTDASDRRNKKIYLTAKGRDLNRRMYTVAVELTAKLAQGISQERQQELRDTLAIMKRNLSAMDLESASTRRKQTASR